MLNENGVQNEPKMKSFGSYFWKKWKNGKVCFDCAGAYGLHMSPSHGALRAIQKSKKKKEPFPEPLFLVKNVKNTKKKLQKVSKWVTVFRGWRLFGGSWDTVGALTRFWPQK